MTALIVGGPLSSFLGTLATLVTVYTMTIKHQKFFDVQVGFWLSSKLVFKSHSPHPLFVSFTPL